MMPGFRWGQGHTLDPVPRRLLGNLYVMMLQEPSEGSQGTQSFFFMLKRLLLRKRAFRVLEIHVEPAFLMFSACEPTQLPAVGRVFQAEGTASRKAQRHRRCRVSWEFQS